MQTLKCVGSNELKSFLCSKELTLMSTETELRMHVFDAFFDFSQLSEYRRRKTISFPRLTDSLRFERCIFIGSLRLEKSIIRQIHFDHCHFINPDFGTFPDQFSSLEISETNADRVSFEKCIFESPIEIFKGDIDRVDFSHVMCPRLWLQCMNNHEKILSIYRFLGRKIYLPDEGEFKELHLDSLILNQVEGSRRNTKVNFVDLK